MSDDSTNNVAWWPGALGLVASAVGLTFAASSTLDYARHLDRQVHDLHCSFVPGAAVQAGADTACRAAMYSPYSALFRDQYWGGVPIALFAIGAFCFFAAFSLYLLLAGRSASRKAWGFFFGVGFTPLAASIVMATISALRLGEFCKTCVGIYVGSTLLAVAGIGALLADMAAAKRDAEEGQRRPAATIPDDAATQKDPRAPTMTAAPRPATAARASGSWLFIPAWLAALGAATASPALLYASVLPDYGPFLGSCGKLVDTREASGALLQITPAGATHPATLVVDPLCPTCKAFHKRLVAEGFFRQLDTTVVLFPLDDTCNWMLDRAVHPGACTVAKAVLCSEGRALDVLEWAYDNQERLAAGAKAKAGDANVRNLISERFAGMDACIDAKTTQQRLDKHLRWGIKNQLQISTPQLFVGGKKLCDEDSDLGLAYALPKLAPGLKPK